MGHQFRQNEGNLAYEVVSQTGMLPFIPLDRLFNIRTDFRPDYNLSAHIEYLARSCVRKSSKGIAVPGAQS